MKAMPIFEIKYLAFMPHSALNRRLLLLTRHLISGTKIVGTHFTKEYHCQITVNPCQNTVVHTATQYGIY